MPTPISDIHIARTDPLPQPRLLRAELPAGEAEAEFIAASRRRGPGPVRPAGAADDRLQPRQQQPGLRPATAVAADIARQIAGRSGSICGLMLESPQVEGRQDIANGCQGLLYGQSVTDACIGWDAIVAVLEQLADAVGQRRAGAMA